MSSTSPTGTAKTVAEWAIEWDVTPKQAYYRLTRMFVHREVDRVLADPRQGSYRWFLT